MWNVVFMFLALGKFDEGKGILLYIMPFIYFIDSKVATYVYNYVTRSRSVMTSHAYLHIS